MGRVYSNNCAAADFHTHEKLFKVAHLDFTLYGDFVFFPVIVIPLKNPFLFYETHKTDIYI